MVLPILIILKNKETHEKISPVRFFVLVILDADNNWTIVITTEFCFQRI